MREIAGCRRGPQFQCVARWGRTIVIVFAAVPLLVGGCSSSSSPSPPDNNDGGGGRGGGGDAGPAPTSTSCKGAQPTPTAAKSCGCNADCDLGEVCIDEKISGYPGGFCGRGCADSPCPAGSLCEELTAGDRGTRTCLAHCATSADCRRGYVCDAFMTNTASGISIDRVCVPHCSSAADCSTATVCDPYYGFCGMQSRPGPGDIGAACAKHADCMSGFCAVGAQFPNGYCTASCSLNVRDCPTGSACESRLGPEGELGICLKSCAQGGDCRGGYVCGRGQFHPDLVCSAPSESLAVSKSGMGSGTVTGAGISCGTDCNEMVTRGTSVTLTAVASNGSQFTGWSGCEPRDAATCSVSMATTKSVVAFFELLATTSTLTVTRSGTGSGTVTGTGIACGSDCSETMPGGTSITLTAAPTSGATFTSWSGCDAPSGNKCTMSMTGSKTVKAVFAGSCAPGGTRCVIDDISVQERCGATGVWSSEACATWKLCVSDACRVACGMTSAPADPTICVVPIADGVNDGEWSYWNDARVESPTYVVAGTLTRLGDSAEIRPAPGETWPFMWRLRASDSAAALFKLNQFGPYRHPALGYRARRASVQTGSPNAFVVGIFGSSDGIGICSTAATATWTADACSATTPQNQSFDYGGGLNSMLLGIDGTGNGGLIDLLDVNYTYLKIAP